MYANHGFSGPARLLPVRLGLAAGALAQDGPLVRVLSRLERRMIARH